MYIVEGNIGSGKSAFLKTLQSHISTITIALKPIATWQTQHGQSLLAHFYQEPTRWAYTLEVLAMMSRIMEHQRHIAYKNPNIFMQHSIYSGHHCFAHNSYENGFMSSLEWHMYNQLFNFLIPTICHPPLGFIYLRTNPELAYFNIKKRALPEEKDIILNYLQQIHDRHESFLIEDKKTLPYISITPVLILDFHKPLELNSQACTDYIDQVKAFIANTQNTFTPAKPDWQMLRRAPIIDDELADNEHRM